VTAGAKPAAVSTTTTSRKSKVVRVVVIGVAWLAMLVIVSAAIADRGPAWLAGTAGGLVAALPLVWHWLRERRRAATTGVLTGGDRLVLRLIAVGGLSIAIAWATARGGMWSMLKRSAGWWWPTSSTTAAAFAGDRFALIPADAALVGWLDNADAGDDEPDRVVFAVRQGAAIVVATGKPSALDKYAANLKQIEPMLAKVPAPIGPFAPLIASRPSPDRLVLAPATWPAIAGGPPSPLVADLATVPATAGGALAIRQYAPLTSATRSTLWITTADDQTTIEGSFVAADIASVPKLVDSVKSEIAALRSPLPDACRDDAGKILDGAVVTSDGTTVHAKLTATGQQVFGVVMCAITALK
jgi:hypothetical protein